MSATTTNDAARPATTARPIQFQAIRQRKQRIFAAAVLILMLDSFLFSLMTGTQVPGDGEGEQTERTAERDAP